MFAERKPQVGGATAPACMAGCAGMLMRIGIQEKGGNAVAPF